MSISIRITVDARRAIKRMKDMAKRAENFKPVFRWAKKELELANAANFTSQGLPVGGWSPLKPQYAAWKAVHFPGAPMLIQDGKLFRSLTQMNGPASSIGRKEATFGTSVEYAKFHQYGTTKMAKRKIVYEPAGFASQLALLAAKHVADGGI